MTEDKNFYVYVWIRNDINKVFYVGKGKKNRINDLSMRNKYFLNVVNKVGLNNITKYKIKENLSEQEAFDLEVYYIQYYKDLGHPLTNMTKGGEGSGDWYNYLTEEEKEKHKEISKSFLGKQHTQETKDKISKAHQGQHFITEDGRKRIKEFAKKRPVWFKGKHHTEESKQKLRESHLGKPGNNGKIVLVIDENFNILDELRSRNNAYDEYKYIPEHHIKMCLLNNSKHYITYFLPEFDFTFIYEEDYLIKTSNDYRKYNIS